MKTLLVGINAKYIHPCLAIYQLKANTSYSVALLEFTIKENSEDILKVIIGTEAQIICFSCYLWNITIVSKLVTQIKQINPLVKIILGGPEVSFDAKYFLNNLPIDFILNGEGENAFSLLLDYLHQKIPLEQVPSITYKRNNIITTNPIVVPNINEINLASFDVLNYTQRIMYLESSRGCPFNCSYCVASLNKRVRFIPINKVLMMIKRAMLEKLPVVKFLDRTFNVDKKRLLQILKTIEKHNISTSFQFEIMADHLDDEIITFLRGLKKKPLRFEIGIQSINEKVNLSVNRKQDIVRLKQIILKIKQAKTVDLHLDLIAGLPFETKESFIQSFNEVISWQPLELQLGFLKFLRGTDMMKMINEHRYVYDLNPPYEIISNQYISVSELEEIRMVETVLNKYYNSGWFPRTIKKLFQLEIKSYYHLFLNFALFAKQNKFIFLNYQSYDLYILFEQFLQTYNIKQKDELIFLLKQDYLSQAKTRPKKWWSDNYSKEERRILYEKIAPSISLFNLEDIYRYSTFITFKNEIFICFYKNYEVTYFHLFLDD